MAQRNGKGAATATATKPKARKSKATTAKATTKKATAVKPKAKALAKTATNSKPKAAAKAKTAKPKASTKVAKASKAAKSTNGKTAKPKAARRKAKAAPARAPVELPDSVELYLNEIARFKLLTPQEEIDLFKTIEHGRAFTFLSELYTAENGEPPTTEELAYLLLKEMDETLRS
jgi:hypothetical protein